MRIKFQPILYYMDLHNPGRGISHSTEQKEIKPYFRFETVPMTTTEHLRVKHLSVGYHYLISEQVKFGYFEQDFIWEDVKRTPIQIVSDAYPLLVIKDMRKHLARCGISSRHAMQEIGTLSGGEQAKVKMCLLMLTLCNFLIMDEPTNHLDTQAKEALQTALVEFEGTVLLVSHEESFYRNWAQKVISGFCGNS